jgi:netrin-G3 ligand
MSLISFIHRIRREQPASLTTPLLVHCSAGVGRTGTFILLDVSMQQMKREGTLSVFQCLKNMRTQRMKLVQTQAQYVFIHDSLSELVVCGETDVAAGNIRIRMMQLQKPVPGDPSGLIGFQKQFETLEEVSSQCEASYQEAKAKYNAGKNRFPDKLPNELGRVRLRFGPKPGSDYINASFIDGYDGKKDAYIAAQGPVEVSVGRFWSMVWEYGLHTIVMLTQCVEAGKIKCVQYWPEKLHDSVTFDEKFHVTYSSNMPFAEYEIRKFKLQNLTEANSRQRTITQLHYTAWPDHGVPDNVMSLIAFIRHVRKLHPVFHQQPLLVHCSAGVGRTGTLILLDIIMQQMKTEGTISVLHWLRNLRMQRMKMVQSQQQYEFIHCGLSELVVCGETEVAAANLRIAIKNLKKKGPVGFTGFQRQMQIIEEVSSHHPVTFSYAEEEYNRSKNRFPDKLPNDTYRVRLRCGPMPGSDYINASFVNGYKQKGAYIATQCPLQNTVTDFWRMVNEFQCGCIVMLCELEEDGQMSSYCFWSGVIGDSTVYGKLTVKLVSVTTQDDIVIRRLEVMEGAARLNKPHMVTLLQLTSWPMRGLPNSTAVLSLVDQLTNAQMKSSAKRTIVMCSDGVSRTGTFLTIHSQVERLKTEGVVDFLQAIKSARLHRAGLVPNTDHYIFCHEVLNTYLENFDMYSNFKFKKLI